MWQGPVFRAHGIARRSQPAALTSSQHNRCAGPETWVLLPAPARSAFLRLLESPTPPALPRTGQLGQPPSPRPRQAGTPPSPAPPSSHFARCLPFTQQGCVPAINGASLANRATAKAARGGAGPRGTTGRRRVAFGCLPPPHHSPRLLRNRNISRWRRCNRCCRLGPWRRCCRPWRRCCCPWRRQRRSAGDSSFTPQGALQQRCHLSPSFRLPAPSAALAPCRHAGAAAPYAGVAAPCPMSNA